MEPKLKDCKNPDCDKQFLQYNSLKPYCSWECEKKCKPAKTKEPKVYNIKRTPIKTVSDKRKAKDKIYRILRKEFLSRPDNQYCAVKPHLKSVEVHHKYCGKDRDKFYLDTTTWLAVSRAGHNWIHENPAQAREMNFLF